MKYLHLHFIRSTFAQSHFIYAWNLQRVKLNMDVCCPLNSREAAVDLFTVSVWVLLKSLISTTAMFPRIKLDLFAFDRHK